MSDEERREAVESLVKLGPHSHEARKRWITPAQRIILLSSNIPPGTIGFIDGSSFQFITLEYFVFIN